MKIFNNAKLPFGVITFCLVAFSQHTLWSDSQDSRLSDSTLAICKSLADQVKPSVVGNITVTRGPYEGEWALKLSDACSFEVATKPDANHARIRVGPGSLLQNWSPYNHYSGDGNGASIYAIQNVQTICFIRELWDDIGDDPTPEKVRTWKPKPGSLSVGCTDKSLFDKNPH